ncbi:glycosyltransferase family protein [Clostridium sp. YIM B02505]|uniref:Glycosyltransferase family protein n=1 Tax=Clostridium yunnanense TaxID=2800325 RepID=A0ABS1EVI4_9CLOT|nr:glycosyltransferase family protein [Clostridium yunnanense]MBK1813399.1 glycosyltransferase family protein [Clostridium yunnanense]
MNDKKVAFITSVNDEELYEESKFYAEHLIVPGDIEVEFVKIKKFNSITGAYNEGIKRSDAKYKVFMHQDVFIVNKNFIYDILQIFSLNKEIGMIGMVGCKTIPSNGVWWEANDCFGKVADSHIGSMEIINFKEVKDIYEEVSAIEGLIMITQYDIPWREDIFQGWHFYDISHSLEFKRNGYKVVVPKQQSIWCIHDCGRIELDFSYEDNRRRLIDEYGEEINALKTN